jgi:isoamyl acetate esterase
MIRVVLIGDSIRMAYQDHARDALAGVAEVWGPTENGGNSVNVLANLNDWVIKRKPDVVHLNCGLHDLKTVARDERETVVPLAFYRRNVATILRLIRAHGTSRVIVATTTPVHEERIRAVRTSPGDFLRFNEDVRAYNTALVAEARAVGVAVNDLHGVVTAAGADALLTPDGVHFTTEGSRLLGQSVARAVKESR